MYSLLRLCLGLVFLAPALAHAQSALDIPGNGDTLSGERARLGLSKTRTVETIRNKDEAALKAMDQERILPSLSGRP